MREVPLYWAMRPVPSVRYSLAQYRATLLIRNRNRATSLYRATSLVRNRTLSALYWAMRPSKPVPRMRYSLAQ